MLKEDLIAKLIASDIFEPNNYFNKYIDLIFLNIETKREKFKTQKHHILPKCYFTLFNLILDNSTDNVVNLLYKDHILAHYYLCLCIKPTELKLKYYLEHALLHLLKADANNKQHISEVNEQDLIATLPDYQTIYEEYKKLNSQLQLGRPSWNKGLTKETDQRVAKCSKPRHFSKEHNENNSKALKKYYQTHDGTMKGKHLSDEAKQKLSKAHKGKYFPSKNPEITSQKLSIKSKKYWETHPEAKAALIHYNKTRILSDNTIKKMKESQKIRFPVVQLDSNNNVLNEFVSVNDAAKECGIGRWRIDNACKTGQLLKEGYYFKYKNEAGE